MKAVAVSLRLYRALARAFPQEFRNAYGDELVQLTEDAIEPIWRRHGLLGLLRLLADVAIRVPAEHLAELRQDIRHGLRVLAGSPGFTAVAIVSLSLGICLAASAFSELNGLFLRTVPGVPRPAELVTLQAPVSYPVYRRYRELHDLFSSTAAYVAPVPFGVSTGERTERMWGHLVTPSYFSALGVRPALGPGFEDKAGCPAVVSDRFWREHLGSDPGVIGKPLRVNGHPCTVVGVGPRDFLGASPMLFLADLWLPLSVGGEVAPELKDNALERRTLAMFQFVGRLKPGIPEGQAEAELDAVARQVNVEADKDQKGRRTVLMPGGRLMPARKQDLVGVFQFFGILVGLVLLIACSNLTNMMLAHGAERRKEIAVRLALGASRARLIRQLMTESLLLAAGGAVLGFCESMWLMGACTRNMQMPFPMPVSYDLAPDWRALVFTLVLTLIAGLAFGLLPAWRATRTDLSPALKEGGAAVLRRYRRLSLRNLLILSQVAGSLTLLLITAFMVLAYAKVAQMFDVGFDPRNLSVISLDPVRDGYSGETAAALSHKLLERVKTLPAVTAASLTDTVPVSLNGNGWVRFSSGGTIYSARKNVVGIDYFDTLGIPILRGRAFRKEDEGNDARSVIVSEKLAREIWKGEDAAGRRIEISNDEPGPFGVFNFQTGFDHRPGAVGAGRQVFEVVGVARNLKEGLQLGEAPPAVYFPLQAADFSRPSIQGVTLIVRGLPGADAVAAVRRELAAMDDKLIAFNARSLPEQIDQWMFMIRVATYSYAAIGLIGLVLASVGLAGVTAYSVARRGREIGIRIALGAQRRDVLSLVMKEGAALVSVGSLLGLAGTWAGMRVLAGVFSELRKVGVNSTEPVLLVGAPLLLAALALAGCYVPARRSLRIDPVTSLRQE